MYRLYVEFTFQGLVGCRKAPYLLEGIIACTPIVYFELTLSSYICCKWGIRSRGYLGYREHERGTLMLGYFTWPPS